MLRLCLWLWPTVLVVTPHTDRVLHLASGVCPVGSIKLSHYMEHGDASSVSCGLCLSSCGLVRIFGWYLKHMKQQCIRVGLALPWSGLLSWISETEPSGLMGASVGAWGAVFPSGLPFCTWAVLRWKSEKMATLFISQNQVYFNYSSLKPVKKYSISPPCAPKILPLKYWHILTKY